MNFKIVVSCESKKNFVWHRFCNCDEDFKIINLILLIEFFNYLMNFEQLFWWSFLLIYSFFIKNLMIRKNIWLFNLNSDFIFNKKLIFILHHNFLLSLIDRFHNFFVEFELVFELWHDESSQLTVCIATCIQDDQSSVSFDVLQKSE